MENLSPSQAMVMWVLLQQNRFIQFRNFFLFFLILGFVALTASQRLSLKWGPILRKWYERLFDNVIWFVKTRPFAVIFIIFLIIYHRKIQYRNKLDLKLSSLFVFNKKILRNYMKIPLKGLESIWNILESLIQLCQKQKREISGC